MTETARSDDLQFADDFRELSIQSGTGAGFQFEFDCECCNDTWRLPFELCKSGRASGWMREASGLLGNLLGGVGYSMDNTMDGLARAGCGVRRATMRSGRRWPRPNGISTVARNATTTSARCWNVDSGLCQRCVPDLAASVRAARQEGRRETAIERAREAGAGLGGRVDVGTAHKLVCPACHAETRGAKFCPQCGHHLAAAASCGGCRAESPAGSRFCPECGRQVSGMDPPGMPPPPH